MALLNSTLNNPEEWKQFIEENKRRTEVDLAEVERVIELARRTPGLAHHEEGLRRLSVFFAVATQFYKQNDPDGLADLVAFWERYRAAVIQRYTGITPVELRAADGVVVNIFDRFIKKVPTDRIVYDPKAWPLVYGGEGGLGAYFTHPPGWNRPFAIINLPHAAFDNVWQWLALPHETGHDLYAAVQGLDEELSDALANAMHKAVNDGEINIPDIDVDLSPINIPHTIKYTGADFLAMIWSAWVNESQADMVGLLNCGGGATIALQQIIGFRATNSWFLSQDANGVIHDEPEEHPTSYVRNALNIAALRLIDDGCHSDLADEIQERFERLRPEANHLVWNLGGSEIEIVQVPTAEMLKSAEIAAQVLVHHPLKALGEQSYAELATFTFVDQVIVNNLVPPLLEGDPTFTQIADDVEPRHALAATVFAFEQDWQKAAVINRTFQHFV
jgi:hypothetical protein